jgi:hypothetical protein
MLINAGDWGRLEHHGCSLFLFYLLFRFAWFLLVHLIWLCCFVRAPCAGEATLCLPNIAVVLFVRRHENDHDSTVQRTSLSIEVTYRIALRTS